MAFIGNGAQLTDLDAGDIASGTLAVARGGTGTASPSLVGGSGISISGSWPNQTVASTGGGVTSLNGQTGAITNTTFNTIGSYVVGSALTGSDATTSPGTSISGSIIAARNTSSYSASTGFATFSSFAYLGCTGTWRAMGRSANGPYCGENGGYQVSSNIFVRVS
jgi:hypothetical protein